MNPSLPLGGAKETGNLIINTIENTLWSIFLPRNIQSSAKIIKALIQFIVHYTQFPSVWAHFNVIRGNET